jgi:hypothetical protein
MQAATPTPGQAGAPALPFAVLRQARLAVARAECAAFPTRLALARWRCGAGLDLQQDLHRPVRAAWFAGAERNFQHWLENGGFVQHETGLDEQQAA